MFEIPAADAPGGVSVMLDGLLAPFPDSNLDWTASCTNGAVLDVCTASQSALVGEEVQNYCEKDFDNEQLCSEIINANAAELSEEFPKVFPTAASVCSNPLVYVLVGVPPGCDLSAAGTATTGDPTCSAPTGCFVAGAPVGITPVEAGVTPPTITAPEPGSLSLLLFGLTGLPFLRRRFLRSP
jgi:hypothetical protein